MVVAKALFTYQVCACSWCACFGTFISETILIVEDADGEDIVKCRWALDSNLECGEVCQRLSDDSLDRQQVRSNAHANLHVHPR